MGGAEEAKQLLRERLDVSRETLDALEAFVDLVGKWTKAINLVSRADRDRIWGRHVVDSFGLAEFVPKSGLWLDIGSGGGFPALPLALLARQRGLGAELCMIESDHRKAAFLRTASRELGLDLRILAERAEDLVGRVSEPASITSRAFASVDKTLETVERIVGRRSLVALLKGRRVESELTEARKRWHMSFQLIEHPLSLEGLIVKIQGFERAQSS